LNRRIIKIICAVAAFVLVFTALQRLLIPKYASFALEGGLIREYYKSTMDQDVIFIGDCEVYANFSTIELWEEYGITSFIRGSPQQLVWHSYYLLEDTLKHARQKPQLIVFNIMAMQYGQPQYEPYNRLTLDGMRMSMIKIRAIEASRLDDEDWLSYFFPFFRYKDHWRQLGKEDLNYFFNNPQVSINGFMIRSDTVPFSFTPEPVRLANYEFSEKAFYYLDKMTMLLKEHDIDLVLIKAPNLWPHWFTEWDDQIIDFANKNDLLYINFLEKEEQIGLDWYEHTFNAGLHLNVFGAELMSNYFGEILQEEYNLPDRRLEPDTSVHWNTMAGQYHDLIQRQQQEIEKTGEINTFLIR